MYALIIVIGMLSPGPIWQCSHTSRCNFANCWEI